jgi:hypothetical protein
LRPQPIGIVRLLEVARHAEWAFEMGLAKPGENAAISGNSPAFDRAEAEGTLRTSGIIAQ